MVDDSAHRLKDQLVAAMLTHAAFDGWHDQVLARCADELGISAAQVREAFPRGALDALLHHSRMADEALRARLEARSDFASLKIRERIFEGVMERLRHHTHEREAIRRGTSLLSLPWNAAHATKALYHTVDTIWRAAGDTSTDYNFYTKRIILGNVYALTLHVWLRDESDALADTERFLRARIENVMQFEKAKAKCKTQWQTCSDWFTGARRA